jgi:hypothetical protein
MPADFETATRSLMQDLSLLAERSGWVRSQEKTYCRTKKSGISNLRSTARAPDEDTLIWSSSARKEDWQ